MRPETWSGASPARKGELDRRRLVWEADASLDRVRVSSQPGGEVEDPDVDDLRVEDLLDLVADHVVDRLHLEFARKGLLDAVDQRQLRVPLPRLVHEARVLERHAEAARERAQQPLVGLVERVLPVVVLEGDDADSAATGDERHEEEDFAHSPATKKLP